MTTTGHNDFQAQDLLAAVTDALLAGEDDLDLIFSRYNVTPSQIEGAVRLIRRLHLALVGVQPSRKFVRRLKADLIGHPRANLVSRVRYLPPRVQVAAGVAIIAGFLLWNRHRLTLDARDEATPEMAGAR